MSSPTRRPPVSRLVADNLRERSTYSVAAVVGTLINVYGQLLVPWLRGAADPFAVLAHELESSPVVTGSSIVLAYGFPLCVGVYSSVAMRYRRYHDESRAQFPDRKPDPVFRAGENGELIEMGEATRSLFERHAVRRAQDILGEPLWRELDQARRTGQALPNGARVYFERLDSHFLVTCSHAEGDAINVYLTRLSGVA